MSIKKLASKYSKAVQKTVKKGVSTARKYTKLAVKKVEKLAEGGAIGEGNNGYIAFYKGKQKEVYANTSYEAQKKAAEYFKAKKSWEVTVVLAEKGGEQVVHTPDFAEGGETGNLRYKKGDIVYVFQHHTIGDGRNGIKMSKKEKDDFNKVDKKYIVGNGGSTQKWSKVAILEPLSDERGWERYLVKQIDGYGEEKEFVAYQNQMSKSNLKPIAIGTNNPDNVQVAADGMETEKPTTYSFRGTKYLKGNYYQNLNKEEAINRILTDKFGTLGVSRNTSTIDNVIEGLKRAMSRPDFAKYDPSKRVPYEREVELLEKMKEDGYTTIREYAESKLHPEEEGDGKYVIWGAYYPYTNDFEPTEDVYDNIQDAEARVKELEEEIPDNKYYFQQQGVTRDYDKLKEQLDPHGEEMEYAKGGKTVGGGAVNGFFTNDGKKFINVAVSKSSPNRIGEVISTEKIKIGDKDVEFAKVKFRDLTENIRYVYEKGGTIPNQYEGKTDEQLWDEWSVEQRAHFLADHSTQFRTAVFDKYEGDEPQSYERIAKKYGYSELPPIVKIVLREHLTEGSYAKGGRMPEGYENNMSQEDRRFNEYVRQAESHLLLPIGTEIMIPSFGMDKNVKMKLVEVRPLSESDKEEGLGNDSYKFAGSKNRSQFYPENKLKKKIEEGSIIITKRYAKGGFITPEDKESEINHKHIGDKVESIKAAITPHLKFNIYEYSDNKAVVGVKYDTYKEYFIEFIFPSLEAAKQEAEYRASIFKGGGKLDKDDKFHKVLHEFKEGTLTDSHGNKVTKRGQALAIAYSEANHAGEKMERGGYTKSFQEEKAKAESKGAKGFIDQKGKVMNFDNGSYLIEPDKFIKLKDGKMVYTFIQKHKGYDIWFNDNGTDYYSITNPKSNKRLESKITSLEKAKEIIDEWSMKKGGHIGFKGLQHEAAKEYAGKSVAKKYQSKYGKKYSAEEAEEVGAKIAGKVKAEKEVKKHRESPAKYFSQKYQK